MSETSQVVRTGKPAGACTHDQDFLAARWGIHWKIPVFGKRQVSQEPFDRVDVHRVIDGDAIAITLARVVANATDGGGQRVIGNEDFPGLPKLSCSGKCEPGLDIFSSRAGRVAWRQQV